jgi:hypothetical protein
MKDFLKTKSVVVLASCSTLFCAYLFHSYAFQKVTSVQPEIAQALFNMVGLDTEIVEREREDDFVRTLTRVIIGLLVHPQFP